MTSARYKWAVVAIGTLAGFAFALDSSMVGIAIAHLSKEFDAGIDQVQWVLTGYLLAAGVSIPSCGYLADRFGMKRAFLTSLAYSLSPQRAVALLLTSTR